MILTRHALTPAFMLFAAILAGVSLAIEDAAVAYLTSTILFSGLACLEQARIITIFRGFLRWALLIVLPSAAFPLDDLGYLPFPDVTLYVAFFFILAALPVFWWQSAARGKAVRN